MTRILDQYEIEEAALYSGSYTDPIFSPGSIFEGNKTVIYSHANSNVSAKTLADGYALTSVEKLSSIFGKGFRLGKFDLFYPSQARVLNNSSSLLSKENISSPSQNLLVKIRDGGEQFADTVLPAPPDVVLTNGGKFTEGISEFIYPGSFYIVGDTSHNLTSSNPTDPTADRQPKKFVITLGSPGVASLTCSSDSTQVSDGAWVYSYPFENKYSALQRFLKPGFNKKYTVSKEQNITSSKVGVATQHYGAVDLYVSGHRHGSYQSQFYTLQYCFPTVGDESYLGEQTYNNRRRYVKLINVRTETSGGIFKPTGSLTYPDLEFIYKGFYGFYKKNNDIFPYGLSLENTKSTPPNKPGPPPLAVSESADLRFNGFGNTDASGRLSNRAGYPIYEACMGYTTFGTVTASLGFVDNFMVVEDFNGVFLRINGWKYGIYDAKPAKSFAYFRRGKFGQLRDMLEQRLYTKYYDLASGKALRAAINYTFVSGTSAYVTSANPSLNTNESGIYDFEGKSGKPFADRDRA